MNSHPALRDVHPDHAFMVKDSVKLKNLYELSHELTRMSPAQFSHHVNETKNDFYNWISHIIRDESLAEKLRGMHTSEEMAATVTARIQELEQPAQKSRSAQMMQKMQTTKARAPAAQLPAVTFEEVQEIIRHKIMDPVTLKDGVNSDGIGSSGPMHLHKSSHTSEPAQPKPKSYLFWLTIGVIVGAMIVKWLM